LGSMMGGASAPNASGDPMGSILGGLLGGETPATPAPKGRKGRQTQPTMPDISGDPMSAILGGLLGGGAPGNANTSALGSNAFLAPIIDAVAKKLGVDPQIASTIVSFALNALVANQSSGKRGLRASAGANDLTDMLSGGKPVTQKYLKDSGLLSQVTAQTGLDQKTATASLQQVFQAFSTQMGEGGAAERQAQYNTLLKSWK